MKTMQMVGHVALALTLGSAAQAATLHETYAGTYLAENVESIGGDGPVSLWFENAMSDGWDLSFVFSDPGEFILNADGTASLTGTAASRSNSDSGFAFSFTFDQDFSDIIGGVPVFKSLFGAVEPDNNFFLDIVTGSLSGFGDLSGLELSAARFPDPDGAATQVGGGLSSEIGSNQHTSNFGLSTWFTITSIDEASCVICGSTGISTLVGSQADIVVDLVPAPVPLPAGVLLLATGLLGLTGLRRRGL